MSYRHSDYYTGDRSYTRYGRDRYYGENVPSGLDDRWRQGEGQHMIRNIGGDGNFVVKEPAVIKQSDMEDYLQQSAVDLATYALRRFKYERDMADFIKKELDLKFGPAWNVVIAPSGNRFAAKVAHSDGFFTYFDLQDARFVMWRTPN